MQKILQVWAGLNLQRQIILIATTGAVFLGIIAMSRIATTPNMSLLYAGLESAAAGEVIQALEQKGVPSDIRGGSIFVPQNLRDKLRLTLASEGLPINNNQGYELLDNLTGFGTTSQMFDAAYWRAKEGELARTIVTSPQISMARVHIARTGSNPFQRNISPKASVSLTPLSGAITPSQARAVRYLVASAIAGLSPDDVSVIDANGALVGQSDDQSLANSTDTKVKLLRERALRILEARVGFGNAIVEVSIDTVTESESLRERIFDPDSRVAISSDTEERTNSAEGGANGDVTVASNLPDTENANTIDGSSSQNSETRERLNYEVSETEREIIRTPGATKRITAAVLVNTISNEDAEGQATQSPRSPEEIEDLRALVASAIGFDESRGDIITIRSLALQASQTNGTSAIPSDINSLHLDAMAIIQMITLGVVVIVLGLFVIRPALLKNNKVENFNQQDQLNNGSHNSPDQKALTPLKNDINEFDHPSLIAAEVIENEELSFPKISPINQDADDPVQRLRHMIGERQEETVEILRNWLDEKEEKRT